MCIRDRHRSLSQSSGRHRLGMRSTPQLPREELRLRPIGIHGTEVGILPVSYTHLDVYKRQRCICTDSFLQPPQTAGASIRTSEESTPRTTVSVSYTHLDVYKRQIICTFCFPCYTLGIGMLLGQRITQFRGHGDSVVVVIITALQGQFIVDYFEYIYGKREEREEE